MTDSPLEVKLAGFNIDKEGLEESIRILRQAANLNFFQRLFGMHRSLIKQVDSITLTPETICASYARISRDPRRINLLRADARRDILNSRKSNNAIIFTMGHKSIAEHATFNFDVMGLSRRAVEELESPRLQSYTEKSQRYITMEGDFVIPKEIQGTSLESEFRELVEKQNAFYMSNLEKITSWHGQQDYSALYAALGCSSNPERQKATREGLGKEDSRYSLALATQAQVGLTAGARNIEVLITKLRSSDNEELKELGEKIFREVDGIAPSVIKYTKPVDYFLRTREELRIFVYDLLRRHEVTEREGDKNGKKAIRLFTKLSRDDSITAGLIFSSSDLSYHASLSLVQEMELREKKEFLAQGDKYQEKHNPKLREYELGDRVTEITLSSSAFAQLKRHRMNTLISQQYLSNLGCTIPSSVKETGLENELREIVRESDLLYNKLTFQMPLSVAEYALTNANKRRVLLDANNRQVHAICLERENLPAQWDIRQIISQYHTAIQSDSPLTTSSLCGKHEFYEVKERMQKGI